MEEGTRYERETYEAQDKDNEQNDQTEKGAAHQREKSRVKREETDEMEET